MSLKKHPEEIANTFADKMYDREIKHHEWILADRIERSPELTKQWQEMHETKMKQITPDFIERFKERMRSDCRDLISEIQEQPCCFARLNAGRFHPDNKLSRQVFEGVTGIKLPATSKGTRETIREYIGLGWIDRKEAEQAENLRKKAEAELKAKANERSNYKDHLINQVRVKISGAELVDLARMLDIEVHPRTAGVLQRNILEIRNCDSMRVYGKRPSTDGAWSLLRLALATIDDMNEPEPTAEESAMADELFGVKR